MLCGRKQNVIQKSAYPLQWGILPLSEYKGRRMFDYEMNMPGANALKNTPAGVIMDVASQLKGGSE